MLWGPKETTFWLFFLALFFTILSFSPTHCGVLCVSVFVGGLSILMAGHEIEMQAMKNSSIST